MVPTLAASLGVKGHRPIVGTRDCKDVLYVFCVLNLITGALHANTLESLQAANRKSEQSKTKRMQKAFAAHLRHVGRMYPREQFGRVVLTIDNAPWHRGKLIDEALADNPQLLNEDPYGEGWLIEIEAGDMSQFVALLDADGYRALTEG